MGLFLLVVGQLGPGLCQLVVGHSLAMLSLVMMLKCMVRHLVNIFL